MSLKSLKYYEKAPFWMRVVDDVIPIASGC